MGPSCLSVNVQDEFAFVKSREFPFADPRHMWGRYWPYRSTLIREFGASTWELVVELSVPYHEYENYGDPIPECVSGKD